MPRGPSGPPSSNGAGCGTDVPSSATRMRHSRFMSEAPGALITAGGRRSTQTCSPRRSQYSALASPVPSPIRVARNWCPCPGSRSPIHSSRAATSKPGSESTVVPPGGPANNQYKNLTNADEPKQGAAHLLGACPRYAAATTGERRRRPGHASLTK